MTTVKMVPPDKNAQTVGLVRNKDGTYDIPRDRIAEMKNIHGFTLLGEVPALSQDAMEQLGTPARKEIAVRDEKIGIMQAEVNTLRSENLQLHKTNDRLAAQLRRVTNAKTA